jgi:hypothetical protein
MRQEASAFAEGNPLEGFLRSSPPLRILCPLQIAIVGFEEIEDALILPLRAFDEAIASGFKARYLCTLSRE